MALRYRVAQLPRLDEIRQIDRQRLLALDGIQKRRNQLPMAGIAERHRIGWMTLGSFASLGVDLTVMMKNLRLQLLERMVMRSTISVIVSGMPGYQAVVVMT